MSNLEGSLRREGLSAPGLGADPKQQDLAPNSGNLAGTPGAAVAPSARASHQQALSNAKEILKQ